MKEGPDPIASAWPRTRRSIRRVLVAAVLTAVTVYAWVQPRRKFEPGELTVYTLAAERMMRGEPIYRTEDKKAFTYPPFFALPFLALLPMNQPLQRSVFSLTNLAGLAAIVLLLRRRLRPLLPRGRGRGPSEAFYWTLVALLTLRHLLSPLENQSHDIIVFFLVALAIEASCRQADFAAGSLAGLGAACKATPLLFAPLFLWQGRGRALLGLLGAAAVAAILPDLLFPAESGESWTVQWYTSFVSRLQPGESPQAPGAWRSWNILNQSLAGTIYRLSTPIGSPTPEAPDVAVWNPGPAAVRTVTLASQLLVLLWLWWVTRPALSRALAGAERSLQRLGEGGAALCAMLLLSPMSSKSHFCVLLLPIGFCLAHWLYRDRNPLVGGLLFVILLVGVFSGKDIVGRELGNRLLGFGSVAAAAGASLFATGYVLLWRSRSGPAAMDRGQPVDEGV